MTTAERNARILQLAATGLSQSQVAGKLGVTKNTVAGVLNRAGFVGPAPRTLDWRCDSLHARMDRVLAETADRPSYHLPAKP